MVRIFDCVILYGVYRSGEGRTCSTSEPNFDYCDLSSVFFIHFNRMFYNGAVFMLIFVQSFTPCFKFIHAMLVALERRVLKIRISWLSICLTGTKTFKARLSIAFHIL